jgi:hypothetical protein
LIQVNVALPRAVHGLLVMTNGFPRAGQDEPITFPLNGALTVTSPRPPEGDELAEEDPDRDALDL